MNKIVKELMDKHKVSVTGTDNDLHFIAIDSLCEITDRLIAAESKLAELEKQEPVAYVPVRAIDKLKTSESFPAMISSNDIWSDCVNVPVYAQQKPVEPVQASEPVAQRITEQDAWEIYTSIETAFIKGEASGISEWMRKKGRTLLDKLNEHREPVDIDLLRAGLDQPMSMRGCMGHLIKAASILLNDKNYDGQGHEILSEAMNQAKNYLLLKQVTANKAEVPSTDKKYFVFDPEGSMEEIYSTRQKAEEAKEKLLEEYQEHAADYGFHEATNRIFWGEVIQEVEVYNTGKKIMFEGEMVDCYHSRWIPPLKDGAQ